MPALPALLFIVFLVLKLVGTIDWSWWWVTAPLWGSVILSALLGLIFYKSVKSFLRRNGF